MTEGEKGNPETYMRGRHTWQRRDIHVLLVVVVVKRRSIEVTWEGRPRPRVHDRFLPAVEYMHGTDFIYPVILFMADTNRTTMLVKVIQGLQRVEGGGGVSTSHRLFTLS